jgi:methyl coenzyme M reductase subunit D
MGSIEWCVVHGDLLGERVTSGNQQGDPVRLRDQDTEFLKGNFLFCPGQ